MKLVQVIEYNKRNFFFKHHAEKRSRDTLNFCFLEKGLGIVSLPHFVHYFSRKMFLMLYSVN